MNVESLLEVKLMKKLSIKGDMTEGGIIERMRQEKSIEQFKIWQCIHIVKTHPGIPAEEVARILGVSKYKVYRHIEEYNKLGQEGIIYRSRGGRKKAYLSLREEKRLLGRISEKAMKGLILTVFDIREEVEKKVGRKVSDDYLWDLFHRHRWEKKSPKPVHPMSNKEGQEEFKKNLRSCWQFAN